MSHVPDTSSLVAVHDVEVASWPEDAGASGRQLAACLDSVLALTGGAHALVIVRNDAPEVFACTMARDQWGELQARAEALLRHAGRLDGPMVVSRSGEGDVKGDEPVEGLLAPGYEQEIVAPLWCDGERTGALCVLGEPGGRPFEADAIRTLTAMTDVLGGAVHMACENARLRARHDRYRGRVHLLNEVGKQLVEQFSLAIVLFDTTLRVTHANEAARRRYRLTPGAKVLGFLEALAVTSHLEPWASRLREVLDYARPWDVEHTQSRDGRAYALLRVSARPLAIGGDRPWGGLLVIEDTSSQLALEKRVEASERYAAVGKLAARVAHELNNPLDGILRYVNMAARLCESGGSAAKVIDYLGECRTGLLRMADLIRELLDFSRSTHMSLEPVDANRLLDQSVRCMFGRVHEGKAHVERDYGEGLPTQMPASLFQVFCNLIKNALDAMKDGGVLTLCTRVDGERQVIEIADTGPGLPDGDPEDLFRPFFTTKGPEAGTGLGLPISRDIVHRLGGTLVGANRPSGGAVFTVDIPLHFS